MEHKNWKCIKCQNTAYETDQFTASGGGFSRIFDVQNKKFTTVTCTKCKYTETYKTKVSGLANVFDFFIGG